VRALALLAGASLALLLATAACDDATKPPFLPEASPSPAATPTATPTSVPDTPTPPPESGGLGGFRAFASQIDAAIADSKGRIFIDRAQLSEVTCTGEEELGPCTGEAAGMVDGVWQGLWRTDAVGLAPPEQIAFGFESFVADAEVGESDGFGAGSAILYALASGRQGEGEAFDAVVTAIFAGDEGLERRIAVYQFTFDGERWRLYGVFEAGALYEEWLSGDCTDCYDQWERWEGNP